MRHTNLQTYTQPDIWRRKQPRKNWWHKSRYPKNQAIKSPEIRAILRTQALGIFGSGLTIQFIHKKQRTYKQLSNGFSKNGKKRIVIYRGMRSFTDMLDLASDEIQREVLN